MPLAYIQGRLNKRKRSRSCLELSSKRRCSRPENRPVGLSGLAVGLRRFCFLIAVLIRLQRTSGVSRRGLSGRG